MPKAKQPVKKKDDSPIIGGATLITLGVIFIFNITFGWSTMWPLFVMFPGIIVVISYLVNRDDVKGAIIGSTVLFTYSIFFLLFTSGVLSWGDMGFLWPTFLLGPGLGLLVYYFYSGESENLMPAGILITIFAVLVFGSVYSMWNYWPVILIVLGILILILNRKK